eukprot:TRINITY_DN1619_c0_g1_i1.p1 TRINITY_DN1619_c0_g1~~TRINITY_DN1619_c0_g1_i1.p1  ORF type:complete len:217 (+),score=36.90 TRINITY_DN1619_c0_g1_i1:887-1537(+)
MKQYADSLKKGTGVNITFSGLYSVDGGGIRLYKNWLPPTRSQFMTYSRNYAGILWPNDLVNITEFRTSKTGVVYGKTDRGWFVVKDSYRTWITPSSIPFRSPITAKITEPKAIIKYSPANATCDPKLRYLIGEWETFGVDLGKVSIQVKESVGPGGKAALSGSFLDGKIELNHFTTFRKNYSAYVQAASFTIETGMQKKKYRLRGRSSEPAKAHRG